MFIVGKILKPQGIKGEVKAEVITSFPEHFEELKTLYLNENLQDPLVIEACRLNRGFVFLKLQGINTRNDAELLRNKFLYIAEDDLQPLNNDEFYHHEMVGLEVLSEKDDYLGKLVEIISYPAHDVYEIENEAGIKFLVPAVKEIVKEVNLESGKIRIHVIEGLVG